MQRCKEEADVFGGSSYLWQRNWRKARCEGKEKLKTDFGEICVPNINKDLKRKLTQTSSIFRWK